MGLFDRFKKPAVNEDGQQVFKVTVDGATNQKPFAWLRGSRPSWSLNGLATRAAWKWCTHRNWALKPNYPLTKKLASTLRPTSVANMVLPAGWTCLRERSL